MNLLMMISAVVAIAQVQDHGQRMIELATADQPLVTVASVDAPISEVWKAWTTTEGITSWMVPSGVVDLRIGGHLRTSYTKGSKLDGADVIENTIICYDPMRMLSIKTTKVPERFPFKTAMQNAWTVIYFEPVGEAKTKVLVRMNGYDATPESEQMKRFFKAGNQATLDALVRRFSKS